jgi:hypothetical protein
MSSIGPTLSDARPQGTARTPKYYDGYEDVDGDFRQRLRYYTYRTERGVVAGAVVNVTFTLERPAKEVWPSFQDFTLWQDAYEHYYSGTFGELEGKTFRIGRSPNEPGPHPYVVPRVIPEHLIVISQPIPEQPLPGLPGFGEVSPGFHVFMLIERDGKTAVDILMEHASYASWSQETTDEEALAPWRRMTPDWQLKWRDIFVPTLKMLVHDGKVPAEWKEKWRAYYHRKDRPSWKLT